MSSSNLTGSDNLSISGAVDPWEMREQAIPLPGGKDKHDGYVRVLFVGTTGAGKTTIVRQLLGTDPKNDRFPSISAAKTTVYDIEVVFDNGPYRAVVTFMPRDHVHQNILDCVISAIIAKIEDGPENEVTQCFLEHNDQRFRLSYILGNPSQLEKKEDDDIDDEEDQATAENSNINEINEADRAKLLNTLKGYLAEIGCLAEKARSDKIKLTEKFGIKVGQETKDDREALLELVQEELEKREDVDTLVDSILEDVESRFEQLSCDGELVRGKDGWPIYWTYIETERSTFIPIVNRFSSNYSPNFGRLLTPLVDGIRVAGPFMPNWHKEASPKIIILDGQGIGHTGDSTSSLSTSITGKFNIADVIVLVDNAAQPMQAGSEAILRSLLLSGHVSKLLVAFTHFDAVKGDNLRSKSDRKDHVMASFNNTAHAIGKNLGREHESALRELDRKNRIFYFGDIQNRLHELTKFTKDELPRFLHIMESQIIPSGPIEYKPIYDVANLVLGIQKATQEFHDKWKVRLGIATGGQKENWTRIKALTRRLGDGKDEYDSLRPVADLIIILQNHLSQFLSRPLSWTPAEPLEESKDRADAIDFIKKEVFTRLHDISRRRLLDERVQEWIHAYKEHRGKGSTSARAHEVARIYEEAAPIPNELPEPEANKFLFELRKIIAECVISAGGQVKGWSE